MLILTENDKIQVVLAGAVTANQLQCVASFENLSSDNSTPGNSAVNTNSTTAIDLIGKPANDVFRLINFLSIFNADTASATITIKLNANGVEFILLKVILATGDEIQYTAGGGFFVVNANGGIRSVSL
jgi:hypothetical protein